MVMTYNSLVAPKGSAGSIMNWVSYTKLDVETVVDEAQSLIFTVLRVRQMRTEWTFGMFAGQSQIQLPDRYLDPIGRVFDVTNNLHYTQNIEGDIASLRTYDPYEGELAADPFTTAADSTLVTVHDVAHGLTQGSTAFYTGAAAVGGLTLNGAFPIVGITDADNYVIETPSAATSAATGGGAAITYEISRLVDTTPTRWAVWDEQMKFDAAFDQNVTLKQLYYRAPAPLSVANPSNWLVARYPILMRIACQAQAANYMKDDGEYQKHVQALNNQIGTIAERDDLIYRGAEFGTDTP